MLALYIDFKSLLQILKLGNNLNFDDPDFTNKAEVIVLLKESCQLLIDHPEKELSSYNAIYTKLTSGVGNNPCKPKHIEINSEVVKNVKAWEAFILNSEHSFHKFNTFKSSKSKNWHFECLKSLLFINEDQKTYFPYPEKDTGNDEETLIEYFQGWQIFQKFKLLPITDAVLVDEYFLKPAKFTINKNNKPPYDLMSYLDNSIFPFIRMLHNYSKNGDLNITVFTKILSNDDKQMADEIVKETCSFLKGNELHGNFEVISKVGISYHKRYLYTNYFSINFGISPHGITNTSIETKKNDYLSILPYANRDKLIMHESDLKELSKLYRSSSYIAKNSFNKDNNQEISNKLLIDAYEYRKKSQIIT